MSTTITTTTTITKNNIPSTINVDEPTIYDEIEIEDMTFDETLEIYHYPCPCGDRFEINIHDLVDGEDIAVCPSCSLMIRVIFDQEGLEENLEKVKKKSGGK